MKVRRPSFASFFATLTACTTFTAASDLSHFATAVASDTMGLLTAALLTIVDFATHVTGDVALLSVLCFGALAIYYHASAAPPRVFVRDSSVAMTFAAQMPSLRRRYYPTPWTCVPFLEGHIHTILSGKWKAAPHIDYNREVFKTPDGGTVSVDWASIPEPIRETSLPTAGSASDPQELLGNPIIVLCHGLTGGSHETYIRELLKYLLDLHPTWGAFVINYRGCAQTEVTSPQSHCAAWTDDLRMVLRIIRYRYPNSPFYGVGFSLGANIITKYSGEPDSLLNAVISIGNPFDLQKSMSMLARHVYDLIYNRALAGNLVELFEKNYDQFSKVPGIDVESVKKCKSVRDFDDRFTRIVFGYPTVDTYYRRASSCNYVSHIPFPALLISAADDPVCSQSSIPIDECLSNPNVTLVVTSTGGHLGFYEGWNGGRWYPKVCDEFFVAVFNHHEQTPPRLDLQPEQTMAVDPLFSDPWKLSAFPFVPASPTTGRLTEVTDASPTHASAHSPLPTAAVEPSRSIVASSELVIAAREQNRSLEVPTRRSLSLQATNQQVAGPSKLPGRSVYIQTAEPAKSAKKSALVIPHRSWFTAASSVAILALFYFLVSFVSKRRRGWCFLYWTCIR